MWVFSVENLILFPVTDKNSTGQGTEGNLQKFSLSSVNALSHGGIVKLFQLLESLRLHNPYTSNPLPSVGCLIHGG